MKTIRRKLSAILCAIVMVGVLAPTASAAAPTFSDVPSSFWGASYIQKCADLKIVNGVGNGKFNPNGTVTFAEFSKMLTNALFPEMVKRCQDDSKAAGKSWYWVYMQAAYNNSLFAGTPVKFSGGWNTGGAGGYLQFLPDNDIDTWANVNMTRYYMAEMTFDALNYYTSGIYDPSIGEEIPGMDFSLYTSTYMSKLKDSGTIPEEHKTAITACMYAGIINGMDGSFVGNQTMTRAEACKVLLTLMDAIDRVKPDRTLDPSAGSAPTPSTPGTTTTTSKIADVSGHKYAEAINALWDGGIITAEELDANGNFRPDDTFNYLEEALIYIRLFNNVKPISGSADYFWIERGKDYNYLLDTPGGAALFGMSYYDIGMATGYLSDLEEPVTLTSLRYTFSSLAARLEGKYNSNYPVYDIFSEDEIAPLYMKEQKRIHEKQGWATKDEVDEEHFNYMVRTITKELNCGAFDHTMNLEDLVISAAWFRVPATRGEFCQMIYNMGITKAGQLTAPKKTGGVISG